METNVQGCELASIASTLEKHILNFWELVTSDTYQFFKVTPNDFAELSESLPPVDAASQIGILLDIDVEDLIPQEKPQSLADPIWRVIQERNRTEMPHSWRMARISYLGCMLSIDEALYHLSLGDFSNSILTFGHAQSLFGQALGRCAAAFGKGSLHLNARLGAAAKLKNDPKQALKLKVRECWEDWQKQPSRYRGNAAFARDMLDKFEDLRRPPGFE